MSNLQKTGKIILNPFEDPLDEDLKKDKIMFSIQEPEFDMSSYVGRFMSFRKICNPFIAFYSNRKIKDMQKLLEDQKEAEEEQFNFKGDYKLPMSEDEILKLKIARTVVRTAIHPDTGEFIPWPMRMSSFIVCNLPISYGMIITAPTPMNTIIWQGINQTYNASVNYGNRNASGKTSIQDIGKSYAVAMTASISVSLIIRKVIAMKVGNVKGAKGIIYNSISAFFAVSTAGFINAYLMRLKELDTGIDIYEPDHPEVVVGKSKAAAE